MKTLKEMFTRKKIKRYWILESECPVEMVSYVVDTLERVGVKTSVSSYHCDSKVKIIAAEFVLEREETDDEVIMRAHEEHVETRAQIIKMLQLYARAMNARELPDLIEQVSRYLDVQWSTKEYKFKKGYTDD